MTVRDLAASPRSRIRQNAGGRLVSRSLANAATAEPHGDLTLPFFPGIHLLDDILRVAFREEDFHVVQWMETPQEHLPVFKPELAILGEREVPDTTLCH